MAFLAATSASKEAFLEQAKLAREERAMEKQREAAAMLLQACVRGWMHRRRLSTATRHEFDEVVAEGVLWVGERGQCWEEGGLELEGEEEAEEAAPASQVPPSLEVFRVARGLVRVYSWGRDAGRLERLCRVVVAGLSSPSPRLSYVGVALAQAHTLSWLAHMRDLLGLCCEALRRGAEGAQQGSGSGAALRRRSQRLLLRTLLAFTGAEGWVVLRGPLGQALGTCAIQKLCANLTGHLVAGGLFPALRRCLLAGLSRLKPLLSPGELAAMLALALRPLRAGGFSDKLLADFVIHVLSVPALVQHLQTLAPRGLALLRHHGTLARCLALLAPEQSTRIVFNSLQANYALCLLANLVELASMEPTSVLHPLAFPDLVLVVSRLLESMQRYVVSKQSSLTHWHPVLGWFSQSADAGLHEALPQVQRQLQLLWGAHLVGVVFEPLLATCGSSSSGANSEGSRAQQQRRLGSPETTRLALTCAAYHTALQTLSQLRLDLLTGLCYQADLLVQLWRFLSSLGPQCGLKAFLELLAASTAASAPEFRMLMLFCDCLTHFVTILDDMEMYEQQKPFRLSDFVALSGFLNQFLFKAVWNNLIDAKAVQANGSPLFASLHAALMALYRRDCRRGFVPDGHWLVREVRPSTFLGELEKGRRAAQVLLQRLPHLLPHPERVLLFRRQVAKEKAVLGLTESACASPHSTLLTVHRSRILEDGYRQLASLSPAALKGLVRVRFVNAQGLDEAGIDQDGVFKEFLEETVARAFHPALNLFRATADHRLYPSPLSHLQEDHLQLFEFVGRVLGKAMYEGIVVEVPFAPFFLTQLLGASAGASGGSNAMGAFYSAVDELPSLDPELSKSLAYVKHFQGDVSTLDLTFSLDEDVLGQVVTHELMPGGKAMPVTNANRIAYIHLVAHFRMHTQIKAQTQAFLRGFRAVVNPEWLALFSAPELQRLISGDNVPLDMRDLRRHTQYYGGFHDSHRVVRWLWDLLEKDFSEEERRLFLKFVTSCSKPPLLGFAHLEPPFSIRCVEVGDDEDTGDTLGSVIRGFFTIRKKDPVNRLPTSSTCFNVLKLPNYQKKSTLRDKLRYAITSNTGFELS